MKQSVIRKCLVTIASVAALPVLFSCQKQGSEPAEPAMEVVAKADIVMSAGKEDSSTKAYVEDNYLYWEVGDKIVMVSNGQINGTLVCTAVNPTTLKGTFSGTISNFTPASVNFFYLGNKEVDSVDPTFDLSLQTGVLSNASRYLYFKRTGVSLTNTGGNVYKPSGPVTLDGMVALLTLKLDPAGSPADPADLEKVGTLASAVTINDLKNAMRINLTDGTVTPVFAKMFNGTTDKTTTTVSPTNRMNYANSYVIAVVPQNAAGLTMSVDYLKPDGSTETTQWSNINWNMTECGGVAIHTDWTSDGKTPTIVEASAKLGYGGVAVEGGENADGENHKGGYTGGNVDDQDVDNPSGNKPGYGGKEVN